MRPALLLAVLATPAGAAVNPCVLDDMVAAAPVVVQVEAPAVVGPAPECLVQGVVARSLRGTLGVGAPMSARVRCGAIEMPGPDVVHDFPALLDAPVVELHLDADGAVAGYGAGLAILPALTDAPARVPLCPG